MRLGGVRPIVLAAACIVLAGEAAATLPTYAQGGSLIVPGRSWGQVFIGETDDGVMSALGPPSSRQDSEQTSVWRYPKAILTFFRGAAVNPSTTWKLFHITVWEPTAVTREGVRIGSPLPDVLRAYGDNDENDDTKHAISCLSVGVYGTKSADGTETIYDKPTLYLTYFQWGVGFELAPAGTSGVFIVSSISISKPAECQPL